MSELPFIRFVSVITGRGSTTVSLKIGFFKVLVQLDFSFAFLHVLWNVFQFIFC